MRVCVRLHATLRKYLPPADAGEAVLDLPEGSTVATILGQLRIPDGHARMMVSNGEHLTAASALRDGQEVNIFPPIAGG